MNLDAAIRAHAVDGADALAAVAAGGDADSLLFWRWLKWLTATHAIGEAAVIVVVAGASIAGLVKLLAVVRQTWIAKTNTPAHGAGGVKYGRVTSVSRPVFQPADPNRGLRRAALASGSSSLSGAATPRRGLNDAIGSAPAAASALRTANGSDSLARKSASVAFADDVDARARRAVEGTAALPPLPVAPSSSLLATSRGGSNATTPRSMTSTQLQHYHQSALHDASQYSGHADGSATMLPPPQVVFAPVELAGGGRPSSRRSTSAAKKATHRRRQSKSHEAADDRGAGKKHATSVVAPKPSAAFVAEPTRQRAGGRPTASFDTDDFAMPPPTAAGGFDVPPDVEPVADSVGTIDLLPVPAGRRHRKDGPQADTGTASSGGTAKHTPRRSRQGDAESAEEALYREPWAVALGVAGPPRQTHRREPLNDAASAASAAAAAGSSDASDGDGSASGTPKMGASSFNDGASGLGIFVGPGSKRPAEAPSAPIRFDFDKYRVSLGELVVRPPTPPPPPPAPAPAPAPTVPTAAPAQAKSPVASTQQDPKPPASTAFGPSKRAVAAPSKEAGATDKVTSAAGPFGQAAKEDIKNSPPQKASDAPKSSPFGRPQAPAAPKEGGASTPDTKPTDDGAAKDDDRKPVEANGDEQVAVKPWSKPFGSNAPSALAKDGDTSTAGPTATAPAKAPGTPGAKPAGKGLGAMNVAFNSPRKPPAIPKPPEGGGGGGWGKPKTADTAGPAAAPKLSNDQKGAPSAPAGFGEGPKQPASPWGQAPSKTPPPAAAPGAKGFGAGTSAPAAASPWGGAQPAPSSSGFSGAKAPSASPIAGGRPPLAPAPATAPRGRYDNDDDVVVPVPPAANGGAASAFGAGSAAFGAPKQPQQAPSGPSGAFGSAAPAPAATGAKSGGLFAGVAPSKGPPPAYTPGGSAPGPGTGAPGAGAFGMTSAVQPASKPPVLVPASGGVGGGGSGAFGSKAPMAPSNGSFGTAAKNPWGNAPAGATAPPSNAPRGRAPAAGRGRAGGARSGRRSY